MEHSRSPSRDSGGPPSWQDENDQAILLDNIARHGQRSEQPEHLEGREYPQRERVPYAREPSYPSELDHRSQQTGYRVISGAPDDVTSRPRQRQWSYDGRKRPIVVVWWSEILGCFLAVIAAVATFATLYPYQGKPLPQWPYSITVNALLSAYMVVLKAGTAYVLAEGLGQQKWQWFSRERSLYDISTYDDAVGGPLGALKLLWRLPLRHLWTDFACFLILVALLVDPFTQQVLQYTDCDTPARFGFASIPRTNIFESDGVHVGARASSITSSVQAAINAGIVAPGGQVSMQCSSGNCTFSDYSTLGYCAKCQDVSQQLVFQRGNVTFDGYNVTAVTTYVPDGYEVIYTRDGPESNFSVIAPVDLGFQVIVGLPLDGPIDPATGGPPEGCDSSTSSNQTWRCRGYGAANCQMYPCVRSYSAEVTNGLLTETLVEETLSADTFSLGIETGGLYAATLNATCLTDGERDSLSAAGYQIDPKEKWIPYNLTVAPVMSTDDAKNASSAESFPESMLARGCAYIMDEVFVESLVSVYLGNAGVFNGNLIGQWNPEGGGIAMFTGPDVLQSIYNYGNVDFERVTSTFKNISESLTNHMRMNPMPSGEATNITNVSAPAIGMATQDKTCLQVDWPWLTLPFALVLFTVVFFFGALSSRSPGSEMTRTWKSSPLPLLFHGLERRADDGQSWHDEASLEDVKSMERLAKQLNVRLVQAANGELCLQQHFERKVG